MKKLKHEAELFKGALLTDPRKTRALQTSAPRSGQSRESFRAQSGYRRARADWHDRSSGAHLPVGVAPLAAPHPLCTGVMP
jgi:hypothetical protein